MQDLASRLKNRVQISSDSLNAYVEAVERGAPRAGARGTCGTSAEPAEASPVLLRQGFGGHPHSPTGGSPWPPAEAGGFGNEVDYEQIVKTYSVTHLVKEAAGRYSPANVVKTSKSIVSSS